MISKTKMIPALAATAAALFAISANAAVTSLDEEGLDSVAGKSNSFTAPTTSVTQSENTTSNGNIQVGVLQWEDDHALDANNHKGANDISGATSNVQASVVGELNAIVWGAYAGVSTVNAGNVAVDQASESWANMYLGGF